MSDAEQPAPCGIHPNCLPPQGPITIWPPSKDVAPDDAEWLVGYPGPDGIGVPLGRVVWFGQMEEEGEDGAVVLEEHDAPPSELDEFLRENLPE